MSAPALLHDGRVALHAGDCLEILRAFPDCSVDSVCTDPPYHLVSIVRRFSAPNAAPALSAAERRFAKSGGADRKPGTDQYGRLSRGFMGKEWDGGDIAFRCELWAEVLRVLKPGGHVLAFSGTRTYHRMACAIEDAGFEIRDMVQWIYGSGFPKSHNISKALDRMAGAEREVVSRGAPVKRMIPGADQNKAGWEKNNGRVYVPTETAPATDAAREWEGWGTALKPALEPICLGRKPLIGTVAENVLAHRTGAINIDGCRVPVGDDSYARNCSGDRGHADNRKRDMDFAMTAGSASGIGRHPANLVHDGSPEVLAGFPETTSGYSDGTKNGVQKSVFGKFGAGKFAETYGDSGCAARFFYSAKADADDRLGSKHPTVKPVDLMRWLVRLITPPGGTVLDPFAGTGTTGHAALLEGFDAILIEREEEYRADIARRMSLVYAGPTERSHAIVKAKAEAEEHDALPLFGAKQ